MSEFKNPSEHDERAKLWRSKSTDACENRRREAWDKLKEAQERNAPPEEISKLQEQLEQASYTVDWYRRTVRTR